jgi:VCBS repeat-containing protein
MSTRTPTALPAPTWEIKLKGLVTFKPVDLIGVNQGPVAEDDNFAVDEDAILEGASVAGPFGGPDVPRDRDLDGGSLTYKLNGTGPTGLTLAPDFDRQATSPFDATADEYDSLGAGLKRTVTFDYTLSDDRGGSDTATAYIVITGVNDAATIGVTSQAW